MKDILTQQSIDVMNSPRLSWGAKGLYLFMAHGPLGEKEVSKEWINNQALTGFRALTSIMRELEANGLIKRNYHRDAKAKFKGVYWRIA